MLFSHDLLRIIVIPLSTTLGTVCTLSLFLIKPVQSNLEAKLPECKIESSNYSNLSVIAANSELKSEQKVLSQKNSSLISRESNNCNNRTQEIATDFEKAEKPMESEVEIQHKQEQHKAKKQREKIKVSSSESQSLNSPNLSVTPSKLELINSHSTSIDKGANLSLSKPRQDTKIQSKTVHTNSEEAKKSSKPKTKTNKQSKQLKDIKENQTKSAAMLASITPSHQKSDQIQLIQTDAQVKDKTGKQIVQNTDEQNQLESTNYKQKVNLTLADTVNLALENNRTIKNSYLQRIIDRQELAVAEDEFVPNFTPEIFLGFNQRLQRDSQEVSVSGNLDLKMPTGATLGVTSDNIGEGIAIDDLNFRVTFDQPLLRDFGANVNLAPIEIARLEEKVNFLSLKSTLINTITEAIEAYLALVQAQEQIKIEQLALENAKRRLEIVEALINAGRRARVELVQSETNVANREVSLLAAQNRLAQAGLDLMEILDIEQNVELVANDIDNAVESIALDSEKLTQLAFSNNPEYLQSLRRVEIEKFNVLLAENEKLWGLDLQVSYGLTNRIDVDDQTDVRAGIILSREFGNVSLEQAVERSQVRLEQANNNLREADESLQIEINNRIRDVKFNLRQKELARRARELSEQQLENEREKLRLGVRGARLIDVLNFEEDLVQAKNRELNTMINYLSSLTRLEQTVGITLDKWNIQINESSQ